MPSRPHTAMQGRPFAHCQLSGTLPAYAPRLRGVECVTRNVLLTLPRAAWTAARGREAARGTGCIAVMQSTYGSVPEAPAGAVVRRGGNWRRAGAAAVATLACIAAVGVFTVYHSTPVALDAGCDEIECMINSPTKPPGAIKVPPRTLNPAEVEKLKEALAEEEQLESKVPAPAILCSCMHLLAAVCVSRLW